MRFYIDAGRVLFLSLEFEAAFKYLKQSPLDPRELIAMCEVLQVPGFDFQPRFFTPALTNGVVSGELSPADGASATMDGDRPSLGAGSGAGSGAGAGAGASFSGGAAADAASSLRLPASASSSGKVAQLEAIVKEVLRRYSDPPLTSVPFEKVQQGAVACDLLCIRPVVTPHCC